jgi:predicted lactoylglutathione lyase
VGNQDNTVSATRHIEEGGRRFMGVFTTVGLGVEDLARSETFYVTGLGFAVDSRPTDDLIYLATGQTRIALYPADQLASYAGIERRRAGGFVLAMNVSSAAEVSRTLDRATLNGGTVIRKPAKMQWGGFACTLVDPDGHLWEIAWSERSQSTAKS